MKKFIKRYLTAENLVMAAGIAACLLVAADVAYIAIDSCIKAGATL